MNKTAIARFSFLAAAIVIVAGCAESRAELDSYIAEVKQRPGPPLPPLPVMKTFPPFEYAAHELRDPFSPISDDDEEEAQVAAATGTGIAPIAGRRKEELESVPLDSLDMVGTIGAGEEMVALIKDPLGVIHQVRTGNYLGQNHGRILQIFEDRIELTEIFPNGLGGYEERRSPIALDDK